MPDPETARQFLTEKDYFRLDDQSDRKWTFYNGEVFDMTGASFEHNLICTNITVSLNAALPDSCYVISGDMRVQVEAEKHDTYPDVAVVCGRPEFLDPHARRTLLNPLLIVEVLSRSTRSFDRGDKFVSYRKIKTLKHYILADQYAVHVDHFYRNDRGHWELEEHTDMNAALDLTPPGCKLPLADIYRRIIFGSETGEKA